ncbi:MAG TPA: hypothetical protein HPQ04_11110 [Rhodospirillaceae bacterium]|nr:hypothetical protein [Rhodospirillaceae bacterium]
MAFWARLSLGCLLLLVAVYGAYVNKSRRPEAGENLFSFFLERENFTDWGRVWRLVSLVAFLAVSSVAIMKMVALLIGGPLIDLDQFK